MAGNKNSGFASHSPAERKFLARKAGRKRGRKGLAAMPPEKAREIQRLGGLRLGEIRRERETKEEPKVDKWRRLF